MVVREQKGDCADQASMHSQWTSGRGEEEEDSSGSSDTQQGPEPGHRKRKADETDEEKRRRNREAAKRCRDKKQKQTEDLKHKNSELEKENCHLAKQRDELIRKCKEYQREIEQHKQQGCVVLHFNPPYNLDHLVQASSPPSPAFSESAPSTSSSPSPAPSISPGPPPRYPPSARGDLSQPMLHQNAATTSSAGINHQDMARAQAATSTSASPATTQESDQCHYLRIRNKDGTHKILKLDHENYLKVMHRLKAHKAAAAAAAAKNAQNESAQASASTSSAAPNISFHQMPFQQEPAEPQTSINANTTQPSFPFSEEEPEASAKSGQKLDTCEDLISILKTHVKDSKNGFEFTPVSESDVDIPIKQEPLDAEYEQKSFLNSDGQVELTEVKQEDMPESSGTWTSTGQQIRTSLDTLTNPDDASSDVHIQNILQFLKTDENAVPVTGIGANTVQQPCQTTRQNPVTQTPSSRPPQMTTYVTSSATMGSLNKMRTGSNPASTLPLHNARQQVPDHIYAQQQTPGIQDSAGGQQDLVIPPMPQIVKLRPHTVSPAPGGQPQAVSAVASSAMGTFTTGQGVSRINTAVAGRINVTSPPSGMETRLTTSSALQPASFQQPPSSTVDTSILGPLHMSSAIPMDNLMSESTSQIAEYLKTNSIETMDY